MKRNIASSRAASSPTPHAEPIGAIIPKDPRDRGAAMLAHLRSLLEDVARRPESLGGNVNDLSGVAWWATQAARACRREARRIAGACRRIERERAAQLPEPMVTAYLDTLDVLRGSVRTVPSCDLALLESRARDAARALRDERRRRQPKSRRAA